MGWGLGLGVWGLGFRECGAERSTSSLTYRFAHGRGAVLVCLCLHDTLRMCTCVYV